MIKNITGPCDSGKSTRFLNLYEENRNGVGLYAKKLYGDKKATVGYNLVLLPDKKEIPFIRLKESICQNENRYLIQGRFAFLKETFEIAERYILSFSDHIPVWIDEVGILELKGQGYDKLLRRLLKYDRDITITMKNSLLVEVLNRYKIKEYRLLDITTI